MIDSAKVLNGIIDQELKLLPGQDIGRLFIGGFSHGACVCIAALLLRK